MCFNQTGNISTLNGSSLKLVDKFTYLGSSVSSTETDIDMRLPKTWTAINRLLVIWKSDQSDKMKHSFFQAAVVSILIYGCTTGTLSRWRKSLTAPTQECCKQYWTSPGGNSPITKTIKVRWTRHAGHCWRSRDKLISDVLLWTPSHGWAKAGWPAWTYIQQLCVDMGWIPEDLLEAMNDGEGWRKKVRDIRADGTTRWWKLSKMFFCFTFQWINYIGINNHFFLFSINI